MDAVLAVAVAARLTASKLMMYPTIATRATAPCQTDDEDESRSSNEGHHSGHGDMNAGAAHKETLDDDSVGVHHQ